MKNINRSYFGDIKYAVILGVILFPLHSLAALNAEPLKGSWEQVSPDQQCSSDYGVDASANLDKLQKTRASYGNHILITPKQCQVSYKRIYGAWLQNKITIVDVRSPQEYEKFHISNSMNLPLYSIKTKTYLKDKLLVLVDEGYSHKHLYEACLSLRDQGFKNVKVLDGGLRSWWRYGQLEGENKAIVDLKTLTSNQFEMGKNERKWKIIAVDSKIEHSIFLPYEQISLTNSNDKILKEIDRIMREAKNAADYGFLIVSQDGANYQLAQEILERTGIHNDYYLTGGLVAYGSYLKLRHSMLVKSAIGPTQRKKCSS